MKTFNFVAYGKEYTGYLTRNTYINNGNMAFNVMTCAESEDDYDESWCNLSTNIIDFGGKPWIAVDENHLEGSNIFEVLVKEGFLKPLNAVVPSGFCVYPICEVIGDLSEWC